MFQNVPIFEYDSEEEFDDDALDKDYRVADKPDDLNDDLKCQEDQEQSDVIPALKPDIKQVTSSCNSTSLAGYGSLPSTSTGIRRVMLQKLICNFFKTCKLFQSFHNHVILSWAQLS